MTRMPRSRLAAPVAAASPSAAGPARRPLRDHRRCRCLPYQRGELVTEDVELAFGLTSWAALLGLERLMLVTATREFSVTYRLDPEPVEVGRAREQVRKALPGWGLGAHTDLAELIVSELVTNAQRHSDCTIEVRLSYDGGDLWIEVWDSGDGRPARLEPGAEDERGRGILLIEGLIELYGGMQGTAEHTTRPGKTVYVAFPLQPGQACTPLRSSLDRPLDRARRGRGYWARPRRRPGADRGCLPAACPESLGRSCRREGGGRSSSARRCVG
jgi:hypothetical protein